MEYSEAALQKVREDRLLIDQADQWLYEEIQPYVGRRVLEIGCGLGNFARHFTDRDLYVGVETSADSVASMRQTFKGHPHVRSLVADATDPGFPALVGSDFDTVFSLNVFEHIDDHQLALRHAVQVLQPGGHMILVVPAHQWLYGSLDRSIGHYRRYDKRWLSALYDEARLVTVRQKYINAMGALGWLVNGRLGRQETPPAGQLRLLNILIPFLKRAERLLPPPFGISVLAVGRKPAKG